MTTAHRARRQGGFTLLELLVATLLAIVFALAGWSFQRQQALDLNAQAASLDAVDQVRSAMGFMSREIRQAGSDPRMTALLIPGTKGLSVARADRLLIQWDHNENGVIDTTATDPNAESVLYSYDAANQRILRTVNGVAEPLVHNVPGGGLVLEYFDILGNPMPMSGTPPELTLLQRDLVAFVRLNLRVNAVGTTRPETLTLSSRVTVRHRILDKL